MLYTYSFANAKRDLADIFSSVIKDEPRFISNFKRVADSTARKHEWLEDQITGRSVKVLNVAGNTVTAAASDTAKLKLGTLLVIQNDPALFRVTAVNGENFTMELAGANGSAVTMAAEGDVLNSCYIT